LREDTDTPGAEQPAVWTEPSSPGPILFLMRLILSVLVLVHLWRFTATAQPDEIHGTPFRGCFRGTEGLIADDDGTFYASEESGRGIIWRCRAQRPTLLCDLTRCFGPDAGMLLGLARVGRSLFIAAPKLEGGSILRLSLDRPDEAALFATHLGQLPNGLISDGRFLFVSETISGKIYRLSLRRRIDTPPQRTETFAAPYSRPNGLALSPDGRTLYIVHTGLILPGQITAMGTRDMHLRPGGEARFSGMGDGLAWWHGWLWACRQREGELVRIDPHHLDHQHAFHLAGGREPGGIRPASIAFAEMGNGRVTGAVTDVARANSFDYVLRFFGLPLTWHHGVYHFSASSL